MFADRLKKSLLQAAITGKLTEQLPTDGDALNLLKKIRSLPVTLVRGVSELKLFYDEYKSKETYLKYPFMSLPECLDEPQVMKAYIISYLSK